MTIDPRAELAASPPPSARPAGLRATAQVLAGLGVSAPHVIFGHTHRAGPLPGDSESEWRGRGGARLVNCGCWTYDLAFISPSGGETPYWPGVCVIVENSGPPTLKRLLANRSRDELAPVRGAAPTPSPA